MYMSPQGTVLNQQKVKEIAEHENVCILCGHYEGVDERVIDEFVDEQISIGDFVLTGGELPALILADSISRLARAFFLMMSVLRRKAILMGCWNTHSIPGLPAGGEGHP